MVEFFLHIINYFRDLINLIKTCGKLLVKELPLQTSAENMIRRMLKIVRDEYTTACHEVNFNLPTEHKKF